MTRFTCLVGLFLVIAIIINEFMQNFDEQINNWDDVDFPLAQINQLGSQDINGFWNSTKTEEQFNYLIEGSGKISMNFIWNRQDEIEGMEIRLSEHDEQRLVVARVNLTNYNEKMRIWFSQSSLDYYDSAGKVSTGKTCTSQALLKFNFEKQTINEQMMKLRLESMNQNTCKVGLSITLKFDKNSFHIKVLYYCILFSCISLIQFGCVNFLSRDLIKDDVIMSRFSLLTIGFPLVFHSYLCLQNLYFSLLNYRKSYFHYFIIPTFINFLIVTSQELRLLWIILRQRFLIQVQDNIMMSRQTTDFFIKFYISLISYFIIMYYFDLNDWVVLISSLYMLPQVIHNACRGTKTGLIYKYAFGVLGLNIIHPLYFRGCKMNFQGLQPKYSFCMLLIGSYFIQLSLLIIQHKFGSRFFLPKCIFKWQFSYYHKINQDKELNECSICLILLTEDESEYIMETPCKHRFHVFCLQTWMDLKLQCPQCRATLPLLIE